MPGHKRADAKWCSARCESKARYIRSIGRVPAIACAHCGDLFVPTKAGIIYCSTSCVRQVEWASGKRAHLRARLTARNVDRLFR